MLLRAVAEGMMSATEAEAIGGEKFEQDVPLSLREKRAFMKLSLEERRRVLEQQAERVAEEYNRETS
jgi:hypothetical protein